MSFRLQLGAFLLAIPGVIAAQVEPAATSPRLPLPSGILNYSILYAQTAEFGGGIGDSQVSMLSGTVMYASSGERHPFTLQYGGGYDWTVAGPTFPTGFFHHLVASQGLVWRRWNFSLSNNVSYLPESPMFGFTGIPGTGESIAPPNPVPPSNQAILTLTTYALDNVASTNLSHSMNHNVSLQCGGSYEIFRFVDIGGLNFHDVNANCGVQWRTSRWNTFASSYQYSEFLYPSPDVSIRSKTLYLGFQRTWSRNLTSSVSLGPQWISSSTSTGNPSSLGNAVNASLTYQSGYNAAGIAYIRGVYSGAGFLIGAEEDTATADYARQFGRNSSLGIIASYMRTVPLQGSGVVSGKDGAIAFNRQLGRYFSTFAEYSVVAQSSSAPLSGAALGQLYQVASFGIGFTSRQERLTR